MIHEILRKTGLWTAGAVLFAAGVHAGNLLPVTARVDIQSEIAPPDAVIDNECVAVGIPKPYAIRKDYGLLYDGKPSFRFQLGRDDNTLKGYRPGTTKGRAELAFCYATAADFKGRPASFYQGCRAVKNVYFYGKGFCPQGATVAYTFSAFIPSSLSEDASVIFAQWHGMPDRRLTRDPQGRVRKLTTEEFLRVDSATIFKLDKGYDKIPARNGFKRGKSNGWMVETGGYPPLAFGFSNGWFYIKADSDRKWMTDLTDRCNANPARVGVMQAVTSAYKSSVIAYKQPFGEFPKDRWVTFHVTVTWTLYGREKETIVKPGMLDVSMSCKNGEGQTVRRHLVNRRTLPIGRNDDMGYYFKYGIYRVADSTVPVSYNLAGYSSTLLSLPRNKVR